MEAQHNYDGKTLTETDKMRLILPNHWLDNRLLPVRNPGSAPIPIPLTDESGKVHTFRLKVRGLPGPGQRCYINLYYMKPDFMSEEWHAFVVESKLEVGENIYVWLDDRGHRRIKIRDPPHLHRLFGVNFLY